jgi:hypothetical protein
MPASYLQQQWKIDPKSKEAWEARKGLEIDGRTITAFCFGVGSIIKKTLTGER